MKIKIALAVIIAVSFIAVNVFAQQPATIKPKQNVEKVEKKAPAEVKIMKAAEKPAVKPVEPEVKESPKVAKATKIVHKKHVKKVKPSTQVK